MRILVYDVAASSGGALTVLNSFYEEFCKDTKNEYIFVLSVCELKEQPHIKVLNFPWIKKSPLHRMYFDQVLAHKLVKKYHADKVLSLQNIELPHAGVPQIVYEHKDAGGISSVVQSADPWSDDEEIYPQGRAGAGADQLDEGRDRPLM